MNEMRRLMEAANQLQPTEGDPNEFSVDWLHFKRVHGIRSNPEAVAVFELSGAFDIELEYAGRQRYSATYDAPAEYDDVTETVQFYINSDEYVYVIKEDDFFLAGEVSMHASPDTWIPIEFEEVEYFGQKEPLTNPVAMLRNLPDYIYSIVEQEATDNPEEYINAGR